ncbi:hypothetical protein TDB9533_03178 [Thalassocella blandensis]|nr:hypothetical protein TDB9533_03178 [Thalassocella blandensis]
MKFTEFFFGKKPGVGASYQDDVLGEINWDHKNSEWFGQFNGFKFVFLNKRNYVLPEARNIDCARKILSNPDQIAAMLKTEKEKFIGLLPSIHESPEDLNEVQGLYIEEISFSVDKNHEYIYYLLGPENENRLWRVFFHNGESCGLGFDS